MQVPNRYIVPTFAFLVAIKLEAVFGITVAVGDIPRERLFWSFITTVMGKGHKSKKKATKGKGRPAENTDFTASSSTASAARIICRTLEEDEVTQCSLPATDGHPQPERCKVHHKQYRTLCAKYKKASELVDEVKGSNTIPTKEDIERYSNAHQTLEKARWMRKYVEAIRVEKTGREIHMRRFFPKGERAML